MIPFDLTVAQIRDLAKDDATYGATHARDMRVVLAALDEAKKRGDAAVRILTSVHWGQGATLKWAEARAFLLAEQVEALP